MTNQQNGCDCKVGRVVAEYELSDVGPRLVDEWQAGTSVRRLEEQLNRRIVESELTATNVDYAEWPGSSVYEALHTDELSEDERIRIRRTLDRAGVDVEELSSDLVSHQTVYRHLTGCLGASKDNERTPEERREDARNTVYALQRRMEAVTESTLETLASADATDFGDVEVLVDLQVVCGDCGRSMDFDTAISNGCECERI